MWASPFYMSYQSIWASQRCCFTAWDHLLQARALVLVDLAHLSITLGAIHLYYEILHAIQSDKWLTMCYPCTFLGQAADRLVGFNEDNLFIITSAILFLLFTLPLITQLLYVSTLKQPSGLTSRSIEVYWQNVLYSLATIDVSDNILAYICSNKEQNYYIIQ